MTFESRNPHSLLIDQENGQMRTSRDTIPTPSPATHLPQQGEWINETPD